MRRPRLRSFRARLFAAFLCATLIPLLVCTAVLLQTFRLRLTQDAAQQAQVYLNDVSAALDGMHAGFQAAVQAVEESPAIAAALTGEEASGAQVNRLLFSATQEVRDCARFDLYDAEGRWRYSTSGALSQPDLSTSWGILAQADRAGELVYAAGDGTGDPTVPQLQAAAPLSAERGERTGYLVIRVYQDDFLRLLAGKYGGQNDLLLLSRYWRGVFCSQPVLAGELAPQLRSLLLDGKSLDSASEEFIYSVVRHPDTGLSIVLRQPQVFTRSTMGLLYTLSASMAVVCIVFSVLLSLALSRQLSLPVRRLTQAMERVGQDDLDVRVLPAGDDELGHLARRFNDMVSALKRNREQLVANQQELTQAQIRMLQAQLNPHFLCNTLDTMKWISKINKVPQVSEMSASLADILRYAVSPEELVPLWREEEILSRYIQIQTVRLSGTFAFYADFPPELSDCIVPKLLLQPLVENAFLHGLDGAENGGITVKVREEAGVLLVTVSDNGKGLPGELVGPYSAHGKPEGHLGLYNVDTILKKTYGPAFGLTLSNRPEGGAAVTAALPVRREEKKPC